MKCVFDCCTIGVRLHNFPKKLVLIEKWLAFINKAPNVKGHVKKFLSKVDPNSLNNTILRVCDKHFKPRQKLEDGRIMYGAVPSINLQDNVNIKNVRKVACEPELFSWQKDSPIVCDETSLNSGSTNSIGNRNLNYDRYRLENISKSVAGNKQNGSDKDLHEGYKCDLCKSPIFSFRYACVQCDNFDLCGACEARGKHATHYVLRVPTPKPFGEVKLLIHTMKQILSNKNFLKPNTNYNDDLVNEIKSEAGSDSDSDPMSDEPDLTIMSSDSDDDEEFEIDCKDNFPSKSSPEPTVPPRANSDHLMIEETCCSTQNNVTATPQKHTLYAANDKNIKRNRDIDKTSNSSQQSLRESKVKSNPQVRVKSIGTLRAPDTSRAHTDQRMLIEDQDIAWLDEDFLQGNDIAQYDSQTEDSIPLLDNTKNSNKKLNQSLTPTKRRNDTSMIINVPNSSKEQRKIIKQSLESIGQKNSLFIKNTSLYK